MSLPSALAGVLKYNGIAVTVNQVVAVASIGLLTFDPEANYFGSPTFTYQARDAALFSATSTVTINIGATNDAPTVSDSTETTNEDTTYTYILADFTSVFSDGDGDSLNKIKIVTLANASHGVLKLSGVNITAGQEVTAAQITSMSFVPGANWNGSTTFTRQGHDGTVLSSNTATMTMSVTAVNDTPTVSNFSKSVDEDVLLTFAGIDFTTNFSDIDGDSLTQIKITGLPSHGTLKNGATTLAVNDTVPVAQL